MASGPLESYRVESRIGAGRIGTVYRARDVPSGRPAAIKVLSPELSKDLARVTSFLEEVHATAKLQHPGIVDVLDSGHCEDGSPYIAMELLDGESLAYRLAREGRLRWPQACSLARQLASALAVAHRAGIVHRDLRPDSVFLVTEPGPRGERTKLLDFGNARLAGPAAGAPAYMSPEQCRGVGQVDHHTDIYSLGCILFEMVCGRPPFHEEDADLLTAHLTRPPPLPCWLAPELPDALERLILRMLAKREADRPRSMETVAIELDAIAGGRSTAAVSARPSPAMFSVREERRAQQPSGVAADRDGAGEVQAVCVRRWSRRASLYVVAGVAVVSVALIIAAVVVGWRASAGGPPV